MSKDPSKHELKDTKANLNRTSYNQSQIKHMSVPIGKLVPCYMNMLKSGESISMDAQFNFRFPPTILPCQTPLKASIDFFAMPIKAVFDDYDLFCNQGMNHTANAPVLPYAYIKGSNDEETKALCERQFGVNSLDDYLECPTYISESTDVDYSVSANNVTLKDGFGQNLLQRWRDRHSFNHWHAVSVNNSLGNSTSFVKNRVHLFRFKGTRDQFIAFINSSSPQSIFPFFNKNSSSVDIVEDANASLLAGVEFCHLVNDIPVYDILHSSDTLRRNFATIRGGAINTPITTQAYQGVLVMFGVDRQGFLIPLHSCKYTTVSGTFYPGSTRYMPDINLAFDSDVDLATCNSILHAGEYQSYTFGMYVYYNYDERSVVRGYTFTGVANDPSRNVQLNVSADTPIPTGISRENYACTNAVFHVKASGVPSSDVYFRTYGIPANGTQPRIKKNVLFERAYFGIYNFNYRDIDRDPLMEDANGEYTTDYNNGRRVINRCLPKKMRTEGADRHIYELQNALLEKDVFTSAMPENLVNITTFVGMKPAPAGTETEEGPYVGLMAKDGVPCALRFQVSGNTWSVSDNPQNLSASELNEAVRIAQSCISTHDLNDAGCLKRWLSNRIQKGYNSSEQQEAITGANSRYNPLTTPTYIGSSTQMVNSIQQTEQSGENCGEPYGLLTLQGGSMNTIRHYATDDCIIMGILRVTPLPLYAETINPLHLITLYDHFYQPEFDSKPWEPIRYAEMCPLQSAGGSTDYSNEIFGWQVPWHAYKFSHDTVTGRFREIAESSLIMRDLPAKPMLGKAFIECDPNDYTYPFEETSYHEMVGFISFDVTTERLASNTQTRVI